MSSRRDVATRVARILFRSLPTGEITDQLLALDPSFAREADVGAPDERAVPVNGAFVEPLVVSVATPSHCEKGQCAYVVASIP